MVNFAWKSGHARAYALTEHLGPPNATHSEPALGNDRFIVQMINVNFFLMSTIHLAVSRKFTVSRAPAPYTHSTHVRTLFWFTVLYSSALHV